MRVDKAERPVDGELFRRLDAMDLQLDNLHSGWFGGLRPSARAGGSIDWKDHKEYVPGDDLRRLDWKLAARSDKYFIRRSIDEQRLRHRLYLDVSGSMSVEGKDKQAIGIATALAYLAVRHLDTMEIRMLRGGSCSLAVERLLTEEDVYRCASVLARESFAGETDLLAAMSADSGWTGRGGAAFVISDLLTDSDWRTALRGLLAKECQVTLIHILSPSETDPGSPGHFELQSVENAEDVFQTRVDRSALRAYREAYRAWSEDVRSFCRSHRIKYVFARSDAPLTDVLLKQGRRAGVIR